MKLKAIGAFVMVLGIAGAAAAYQPQGGPAPRGARDRRGDGGGRRDGAAAVRDAARLLVSEDRTLGAEAHAVVRAPRRGRCGAAAADRRGDRTRGVVHARGGCGARARRLSDDPPRGRGDVPVTSAGCGVCGLASEVAAVAPRPVRPGGCRRPLPGRQDCPSRRRTGSLYLREISICRPPIRRRPGSASSMRSVLTM